MERQKALQDNTAQRAAYSNPQGRKYGIILLYNQWPGSKEMIGIKQFIMVNGTMGVGKTAVCQQLLQRLTPSVYLDGDWCWNMNPFVVTEENKEMVLQNISFLLRSFLQNSQYQYIIFGWVMHQKEIMEDLLHRIGKLSYQLHIVTLLCTAEALRQRLAQDILNHKRKPDIVERSLARLDLYKTMDTVKLDVSRLTPEEAAERIARMLQSPGRSTYHQ